MKPGTATLKRTAFARAERKEVAEVEKLRRLRTSRPKMTSIRRAAQGQDCTLQLSSVCNRNPETTVLCHSNALADGKGMGLKAPDTAAAFGCSSCHDVLDGRRPRPEGLSALDVENSFYIGVMRTHQVLRRLGLIKSEAATGCNP